MKLGLLGSHISHSYSKIIHESSAQKLGLNISYEIFDTPSEKVLDFLEKFWLTGGHGFNITTPYKKIIAKHIGSIDNSVNTVYRGKNGWLGTSTDGIGFANALFNDDVSLENTSEIIFIGAGGAVSAILNYLSKQLTHIPKCTIMRRSADNDKELQSVIAPETLQNQVQKIFQK